MIGKKTLTHKGIGKAVDFLLPNVAAYERDRTKCGAISAKTSLRERWQQVANELSTTGLPSIFLATLDQTVTLDVVESLYSSSIKLVVPAHVKENDFADVAHVFSFDQLFRKEIPHIMEYFDKGIK